MKQFPGRVAEIKEWLAIRGDEEAFVVGDLELEGVALRLQTITTSMRAATMTKDRI